MVVFDAKSDCVVGFIPHNDLETVSECIEYLGGEVIDENDPRWSDKGDNTIINGTRYRQEDLVARAQLLTEADLFGLFIAAMRHDLRSFIPDACAYYCIMCLPMQKPVRDRKIMEQFCVLWHVANDPFQDLLNYMGLDEWQCRLRFVIDSKTMQGWLSGDVSVPPHVRLMMAEATGVLKLCSLT